MKTQAFKMRAEPEPIAPKPGPKAISKERLRLWLRLLSCSHSIEREIRRRFESEFDVTLPRFDVMAALNRHPEGLTMGSLSRWLRVSNGNVTGVVARLEADGLVRREPRTNDQRVIDVRLTAEGRAVFDRLAAAHEGWVDELLGCLDGGDTHILTDLLGHVRDAIDHKLETSE
jgi:DNA-binding MarR family transcriptional regulator